MKKIQSNNIRLIRGALLGAALIPLASCSGDWDNHYSPEKEGAESRTVMQVIKGDPSLSKFARMIEIAGLEETLDNTRPTPYGLLPTMLCRL